MYMCTCRCKCTTQCTVKFDFFQSLCRIYAGIPVLISLSVATHSAPNFSQRKQSLISMLLARLQNHNTFDKSHLALCANGHPMYKISSIHNNHNKDRSWNWECRPLLESRYPKCHEIGYMCTSTILIDLWPSFTFGPDEYIQSTESYRNNPYEDRRCKSMCCSTDGYRATACKNVWPHEWLWQPTEVWGRPRRGDNWGYSAIITTTMSELIWLLVLHV